MGNLGAQLELPHNARALLSATRSKFRRCFMRSAVPNSLTRELTYSFHLLAVVTSQGHSLIQLRIIVSVETVMWKRLQR